MFREPLVIVASVDNPLANRRHVPFDDLRRCTLVAPEVHQTYFDILTTPFMAAGFDPCDIESAIIDDFLEFARHVANLSRTWIMRRWLP